MRRGQISGVMDWFVRLIVMAVAVIVIAMLVRYYANRDVDAANITIAAHQYRLYYGDVIMYQDNTTKRVYPGIVDLQKFSNERLAEIFNEDARISSCLTIASAKCQQFNEQICFNQDLFDIHLAQANLQGVGGASVASIMYPVTLKDKERECPGILNMTIVRPNQ